jgi:hypothetical protein
MHNWTLCILSELEDYSKQPEETDGAHTLLISVATLMFNRTQGTGIYIYIYVRPRTQIITCFPSLELTYLC